MTEGYPEKSGNNVCGGEKRRHPRRPYWSSLEFRPVAGPVNFYKLGASVDISESGLCMYTFDELAVGDRIEIKNRLPVPYTTAIVKWIKKYSGSFNKAGLMFTDEAMQTAPSTR